MSNSVVGIRPARRVLVGQLTPGTRGAYGQAVRQAQESYFVSARPTPLPPPYLQFRHSPALHVHAYAVIVGAVMRVLWAAGLLASPGLSKNGHARTRAAHKLAYFKGTTDLAIATSSSRRRCDCIANQQRPQSNLNLALLPPGDPRGHPRFP